MNDSDKKIKVVALVCSGQFQWYFLNCLQERYELAGVVFCDNYSQAESKSENKVGRIKWKRLRHLLRYLNLLLLFRHIQAKIKLPAYEIETEKRLQENFPNFVGRRTKPEKLNSIIVSNVNDSEVCQFIAGLQPDLVCVNGTNLIREPLLSQCIDLSGGLVNLHTGLSPYSRGGNCNLFMLLEDKPEYVGATIHYIDRGIDSGDIIRTLRPDMAEDDPYEYIEASVFITGFDELIKIIPKLLKGEVSRVKQWEQGKLFLKRTGYEYQLYHRLLVNKKIDSGLLTEYLLNQAMRDQNIRLID